MWNKSTIADRQNNNEPKKKKHKEKKETHKKKQTITKSLRTTITLTTTITITQNLQITKLQITCCILCVVCYKKKRIFFSQSYRIIGFTTLVGESILEPKKLCNLRFGPN